MLAVQDLKAPKTVPVTTVILPEVNKDKKTKELNVTKGDIITTYFALVSSLCSCT